VERERERERLILNFYVYFLPFSLPLEVNYLSKKNWANTRSFYRFLFLFFFIEWSIDGLRLIGNIDKQIKTSGTKLWLKWQDATNLNLEGQTCIFFLLLVSYTWTQHKYIAIEIPKNPQRGCLKLGTVK
jgi:hypothetical protein